MYVLILSKIKYVCFDFIEHKICVLILSYIKYECFDFIENKVCVF